MHNICTVQNVKDTKEKVPEQHNGAKSDVRHTRDVVSNDEAAMLYLRARKNILDINNWQNIAGKLSASFSLTDPSGAEVSRLPLAGDYIKIHLPTSRREKFDWVRIEKVSEEHPDDYTSRIQIQVRPSEPPTPQQETEHFFSKEATSSFFVERKGKRLSAEVRGRNELPNLQAPGLLNKVRNAFIALGAMAGLNTPQWAALVKGVLEK